MSSAFFLKLLKLLKPTALKLGLIVTALASGLLLHSNLSMRAGGAASPFIESLDRLSSDMRFRLRGPRPVSGRVGVLAVDEASISRFGRWPFSRSIYEKALNNLRAGGVKWIGFDSVFSEAERAGLEESAPDIVNLVERSVARSGRLDSQEVFGEILEYLGESQADKSMGRAFESFGNVVQGYFFFENPALIPDGRADDGPEQMKLLKPSAITQVRPFAGKGPEAFEKLYAYSFMPNTPSISGASRHQGFFNNKPDTDGIARQMSLVQYILPHTKEGEDVGNALLMPSLSLLTAARALDARVEVGLGAAGVASIRLVPPEGSAVEIPSTVEGTGRILLSHYGRRESFPYVSLKDAHDGLPEGTPLPEILLFGAVATGLGDIRPNPFDEMLPGVENHATALENMLTGTFMRRSSGVLGGEVIAFVLLGIVLSVLLARLDAIKSAAVLFGFIGAYALVDQLFLFNRGIQISSGLLYVQSFGVFLAITSFKYFTEEREKKKVRGAFQHYLNPAVINQLLEHPDQLKLGGQRKELTVLFSDVRGFTTISESLEPDALAGLLNEYFTPMTALILDSQGLLDKYIGDAIMAVWGAPMEFPDHADRAVTAALKMLVALDELRPKWKARGMPDIDIGIGINTGFMSVGNMGSEQRFDYTVLGDSVNLGARLEGITKEYGVRLVISEFAASKLTNPDAFIMRELDLIRVKGKNEPVRIFEVLSVGEEGPAKAKALAASFLAALELYRAQRWDEAIAAFEAILADRPGDGPAEEFIDRCKHFRSESPGEAWNGVWVMKTK